MYVTTDIKFINLTPHPVVIEGPSGRMVFEPSGNVCRLIEEEWQISYLKGIPIVDIVVGRVVEGLPPKKPGVFYIVSRPVAIALAGIRDDLVVPDDFVRDEQGNIVAARRFARFFKAT